MFIISKPTYIIFSIRINLKQINPEDLGKEHHELLTVITSQNQAHAVESNIDLSS